MTEAILGRAAERHAAPWKNGGGFTREVAAFPPACGLSAFQWRISIAEIHKSGPFSCFPGIDRIIAIMDGELRLSFESHAVTLSESDAPLLFSGDAPLAGAPLNGPACALNLMVRRGAARATLRRNGPGAARLEAGASSVIVARNGAMIQANGAPIVLGAHDAAIFHNVADRVSFKVLAGEIYVASISLTNAA